MASGLNTHSRIRSYCDKKTAIASYAASFHHNLLKKVVL